MEVRIVPNPAKDKFEVWSSEFKAGSATIELYDLNGRKLLEKQIPSGTEKFELDVSGLNSGVYMCRVTIDNKSVTKKLIIR